MGGTGRLVGIAVRREAGGPMRTLQEADVTVESGVGGDPRGEPGPRQVSVLAREAWSDTCRELAADVPWTARRANLLLEGVTLDPSPGGRLQVGSALLEICSGSDPCEQMDETHPGLRAALGREGRGGVMCRVVDGGRIRVGNAVRAVPGPARA